MKSALTPEHRAEERPSLIRHDWCYPGDLGRFDEDSFLQVVGRDSEFIIRDGSNVYPAEVESVLLEHPEVVESAVLGFPSARRGEDIGAVVVVRGSASAAADLRAHCIARLMSLKVPARIVFTEAFPRTLSGKIDKKALVRLFED